MAWQHRYEWSAAHAAVGTRWRSRPVLSWAIRAIAVLLPIAASVAVGIALASAIPPPDGWLGTAAWYALLLVPTLAVLVVVDRLARRLLPLAMLLRLSLVFPDRAPRRMAIALRATNARRLQGCLHEVARGQDAGLGPVITLAASLNAHDRRTRGHSDRVRALTDLVAEEMHLSEDDANRLRWASFLHDIGKLTVPAAVLNKTGELDGREWRVVHRHPERGEELAAPLKTFLGDWIHAIGEHHEHFDGTGYPFGKTGSEITKGGRIVAVTDAFETMTALRSYNKPMTPEQGREELTRCAGKHFDPKVVRAFLNISVGRLRWTAGLAAWIAQLPFVGVPARAGAQMVTAAAGAESGAGSVVSAIAVAAAGVATPLAPVVVGALSADGLDHPVSVASVQDDGDTGGGGPGHLPTDLGMARFIVLASGVTPPPSPPGTADPVGTSPSTEDGKHGGGVTGPGAGAAHGNFSGWGNGNTSNNGNHNGWSNPGNPHSG
jgi:HD-GYP domain-containing protein (c-di-GMP phosphodiesterase class II)